MRSTKEVIRRYLVFLFGLAVMALAVALMAKASLGISPVQSLCYIINKRYPELISLGMLIFIWNCILLLFQFILKGKSLGFISVLQIPLSFFLGAMVDLWKKALDIFCIDTFVAKIIILLCGIFVLACAISITVAADTVMNSGEAFVDALSKKLGYQFGKVKTVFDISMIAFSITASFILFRKWRFDVIGIGTLIAATGTGFVVSVVDKKIKPLVNNIVKDRK